MAIFNSFLYVYQRVIMLYPHISPWSSHSRTVEEYFPDGELRCVAELWCDPKTVGYDPNKRRYDLRGALRLVKVWIHEEYHLVMTDIAMENLL